MTRDEIVGMSQGSGGMFVVIPSVVMKDESLSMSAKMLYGIITWKCNENAFCWPTNRALGEEMGLSAKRISSLLAALEANGHIETEIVRDRETGQILRRYIYPVVKSSRKAAHPIPKNEETPPENQGDPIPENGEEKYKEEMKRRNIPPKAPQGGRRPSKYDLAEDAKPVLRAYCGEDQELARALADLIEIRRDKRAINSKRGIQALLRQLDELSKGDRQSKLLLLRQATANSWKSVFPLRGGGAPPPITAAGVVEEEGTYLL